MPKRVLIIGGYGQFGSIVARKLVQDPNIQLIVGGRSLDKAKKFIAGLKPALPDIKPEAALVDLHKDLEVALQEIKPNIVIHTAGPFQDQGYGVVEACLQYGCHYIDLADARDFVSGITHFDQQAKDQGLLVISGASTVPCLTAATVDEYRPRFAVLERVDYGITAAHHAVRGLSTVQGVLSYIGSPFTTLDHGEGKTVYGWQDMHEQNYPELGKRRFGACDIPDLELFPARYTDLRTMRFGAGTELAPLQIGLWLLSWLVRFDVVPSATGLGPALLSLSKLFDSFGTKRGGFHMLMYGKDADDKPHAEAFYIIARKNHGIYIPCVPAILLAKRLASGALTETGAKPCLDLIKLDDYLAMLRGLDITVKRDIPLAAQPAEGDTHHAEPVERENYSYREDSNVPSFPDDKPLFVFDGTCVMCSTGAAWLMKKRPGTFRFASAQSPLGQALYRHYGLAMDDTYLLIHEGQVYTKSGGYLRIAEIMEGLWVYLEVLSVIPRALRDWVYDVVARHRYKWFGQTKTQCERIPEEYRKNMLE